MKLTGAVVTFTVSGVTFSVSNEAYIGTHMTAPVSLITDCKVTPPTVKVTTVHVSIVNFYSQ